MNKQVHSNAFTRVVRMLAAWQQRVRDRSVVAAMNQHELRDLGLRTVRVQSSNPVWRG